MKRYDIYSMVLLCLAVAFLASYGCAPIQINGGGTLPSTSGIAGDKANFGFYGNNCTPGAITGTFNYLDKKAPNWPNGGVKLNGVVVEVAKCSEGDNFSTTGIACGICNLQFCNCPGWPGTLGTCVSNFLADPLGFCYGMNPIPNNLYGVGFQFTSTNPRYPGGGLGVACITDNGQGTKAINQDNVALIIVNGQYQGYMNQGPVQGNTATGPCCHDLCLTGFPPVPSCDPCVAAVCAVDAHCCATTWDLACIGEAQSICGIVCAY